MRWFTRISAALTFGVGLGCHSPKGDPAKADRDGLQGIWVLTESIDGGEFNIPPFVMEKSRLTFRDDRFRVWQDSERTRFYGSQGPYSLDPSKVPKTIDFEFEIAVERGTSLGIYELDGDKLRICWGGINSGFRPDKFSSPKDSKVSLTTYKRISHQPEPQ